MKWFFQQFTFLPAADDVFHQFTAYVRCPAAIPKDCHFAVLNSHGGAFCQESSHGWVEAHIHRRRRQYHMASAEHFCPGIAHRSGAKVDELHVFHAPISQKECQFLGCHIRMSIGGRKENGNGLVIRRERSPFLHPFHHIGNIFFCAKHRPMEGADDFHIQRSHFFQRHQHIHAIFSGGIGIVPTTFHAIHISIIYVVSEDGPFDGPKGTKCIGREQHLFCFIIGKGHFRPMDHGRFDEMQLMVSQIQHHLFIGNDVPFLVRHMEKLFKHFDGLGRGDDFRFRIGFRQSQKRTTVIRFHMVDNDVVQCSSTKQMRNIVHEKVPGDVINPI